MPDPLVHWHWVRMEAFLSLCGIPLSAIHHRWVGPFPGDSTQELATLMERVTCPDCKAELVQDSLEATDG